MIAVFLSTWNKKHGVWRYWEICSWRVLIGDYTEPPNKDSIVLEWIRYSLQDWRHGRGVEIETTWGHYCGAKMQLAKKKKKKSCVPLPMIKSMSGIKTN